VAVVKWKNAIKFFGNAQNDTKFVILESIMTVESYLKHKKHFTIALSTCPESTMF